jgi:hypothetical protein
LNLGFDPRRSNGRLCTCRTTAMLALHESEQLSRLGCEIDSKVADVFARIPGRMKKPPANAAEIFAALAAAVEEEYQVDTLSEMMELLLVGQFEKLLTQAGGKATWIAWLEMIFGMKFKTGASQPPSAQLLALAPAAGNPNLYAPTFKVQPLGALMLANGTLADEILPEYIFDAITECEDVTKQQISPKDLTAVLDAYQHYMIVTHKVPFGDKVMRAHHAKQLKARIPHLPDHGKTAGATRKFDRIIQERKRNFSRTKSLKVGPQPARAMPPPPCGAGTLPPSCLRATGGGAWSQTTRLSPRLLTRLGWLPPATCRTVPRRPACRTRPSMASPSPRRRPRTLRPSSRPSAPRRASPPGPPSSTWSAGRCC